MEIDVLHTKVKHLCYTCFYIICELCLFPRRQMSKSSLFLRDATLAIRHCPDYWWFLYMCQTQAGHCHKLWFLSYGLVGWLTLTCNVKFNLNLNCTGGHSSAFERGGGGHSLSVHLLFVTVYRSRGPRVFRFYRLSRWSELDHGWFIITSICAFVIAVEYRLKNRQCDLCVVHHVSSWLHQVVSDT